MTHAIALSSPWYVAGLRHLCTLAASMADGLDRAFQPAPRSDATGEDHELILARAAEESLANTRHRLSRYY